VLVSLLAGHSPFAPCARGADDQRDPPLPPGAVKRLALKSSAPDSKPLLNVYQVAFTPDGKLVAAGCSDNTIHFWDLPQAKEHEPFRIAPKEWGGHGPYPQGMVFAPVGRMLAFRHSYDYAFRIWNITGDREAIKIRQKALPSALAFAPEGQVLASPDVVFG